MGASPGHPTRYLAGPQSRPVRPPRRSHAADLCARRGGDSGGGSHRGHGEQDRCRTGGRGAPMPEGARMAGSGRGAACSGSGRPVVGPGSWRPAVHGGYQPEPSARPCHGGPRHGVLAAELTAHAAAGRSPPAADGHEDHEGQRRGHHRTGGGHRHRHHQGRVVKVVSDGPGEHQPCDEHDNRQPTRRAGITDHGLPLFAGVPSRGGRASLPSYSCIAQLSGKVKTQCRPDVSAA